jgi:hypothetical protein
LVVSEQSRKREAAKRVRQLSAMPEITDDFPDIHEACLFWSSRGNDKVIYPTAMTRFATLIIAVSFCSNAAAAPLVTYESPSNVRTTTANNAGRKRMIQPYRLLTRAQFKQ